MRDADEESHYKIRAMMTGPLETTLAPRVIDPNAPRMPAKPWWWGDDDDVTRSNMAAATALRRGK